MCIYIQIHSVTMGYVLLASVLDSPNLARCFNSLIGCIDLFVMCLQPLKSNAISSAQFSVIICTTSSVNSLQLQITSTDSLCNLENKVVSPRIIQYYTINEFILTMFRSLVYGYQIIINNTVSVLKIFRFNYHVST